MDSVETKLKSFWEKPEGKTGMLAVAAGIGVGFIVFVSHLAWILKFVTDTLHLILTLGIIATILFLITNGQVRALASVSFQLLMKKITGFIVKIDPLDILKMKVREMEENLEKMSECISKLKEVLIRLGRKIQQNTATLETSMKKASFAQSHGEAEQIYLQTRKAGRMQKSNMTLQALYNKMDSMHRVLSKIQKNCAVVIEDTKDEIDVTSEEYLAVKAAHGAMKSAMSVINGNKDKRAIYELAYEEITNDIVAKSADIEQMLDMSDSLMKNIDLDQGMMQDQGLEMLEAWEKKADNWLVSSAKKNDVMSKATGQQIPHKATDIVENAGASDNQFSNLFNKNN
jgi:peptidyl-tRNA hydrolase